MMVLPPEIEWEEKETQTRLKNVWLPLTFKPYYVKGKENSAVQSDLSGNDLVKLECSW